MRLIFNKTLYRLPLVGAASFRSVKIEKKAKRNSLTDYMNVQNSTHCHTDDTSQQNSYYIV